MIVANGKDLSDFRWQCLPALVLTAARRPTLREWAIRAEQDCELMHLSSTSVAPNQVIAPRRALIAYVSILTGLSRRYGPSQRVLRVLRKGLRLWNRGRRRRLDVTKKFQSRREQVSRL